MEYAHLTHKLSGREVDYFNTHLCLCNDDQLLGSAVTIADTIAAHRRPGSRIILTGDFNCDGEQSKPVRSVRLFKTQSRKFYLSQYYLILSWKGLVQPYHFSELCTAGT